VQVSRELHAGYVLVAHLLAVSNHAFTVQSEFLGFEHHQHRHHGPGKLKGNTILGYIQRPRSGLSHLSSVIEPQNFEHAALHGIPPMPP
jgi:hypothetical protein